MELVVLVEPSKGTGPGHMVIGQEAEGMVPRYYGFRFHPKSLPTEYRLPERWQEYFLLNKTIGGIVDETDYVAKLRKLDSDAFCEKRVSCNTPLETLFPSPKDRQHCAYYSFRPDGFHTDAEPCYNCVTWATMIGNKLAPGFLTPVRQGRIKLILQQLRAAAPKTGEFDG